MNKWYTIKEMAKILRCHRCTISKLIKQNKLHAINVGEGVRPTWKISEESYLYFINNAFNNQNDESTIKKINLENIDLKDRESLKKIIMSRINKNKNDCWEWKNSKENKTCGYLSIVISDNYYAFPAPNLSYALWKKTISDSTSIYHKCCNPSCCNPNHLYIKGDKNV